MHRKNEKMSRHHREMKKTINDELNQALLSGLFEQSGDLLFILDVEGRIRFVNRGVTRSMGYREKDITGHPFYFLRHPAEIEAEEEKLRQTIRKGFTGGVDMTLICADGSPLPVNVSGTVLRNEAGQMIGMLLIGRDVTERKLIEHELSEARRQIELRQQVQNRFLWYFNHEIRTPVHTLLGMIDLIANYVSQEPEKQYIGIMRRAVKNMVFMIEGLMDLMVLDREEFKISEHPFDMEPLVEDVLGMFTDDLSRHGIDFGYQIKPEVRGWWIGDEGRIRRSLINLINLAIKRYHPSVMELTIDCKTSKNSLSRTSEFLRYRLEVLPTTEENSVDTESDQRSMKSPLSVFEEALHQLLRILKGELDTGDGDGNFKWFSLTIPLKKDDDRRSVTPTTADRLKHIKTLLIAPDSAHTRMVKQSLQELGCTVDWFMDADSALDTLYKKETVYSLIALDMNLERIDGIQLIRRIRSIHDYQKTLVLLFYHGSPVPPTILKDNKPIVALPKPTLKSIMVQELLNRLAPRLAEEESRQKSIPPFPWVPHLLVVDDDEDHRRIIRLFLTKAGYQVDEADTGREALDRIRRRNYDLVLLDIQMPDMDGLEVVNQIRKEEDERHLPTLPIIGVTAYTNPGLLESYYHYGIHEVIPKPVDRDELLNRTRLTILSSTRVMIVDDSEDQRLLLMHFLKSLGVPQIVAVEDGITAIGITRFRRVHLIFLDLEMPQLTGYETVRLMRQQEHLKEIPILAMTAHEPERVYHDCKKIGFNDVIQKPIRKPVLKRILQQYFPEELFRLTVNGVGSRHDS